MPEPAIIDTTVIQIKSITKDTYGNLLVTPEVGEDVKISQKREKLFDVFVEGRAVKLYWAEYKNRKYVARAELFDGKPPIEKQIEPIKTDLAKEAVRKGAEVIGSTSDPKLRSMVVSYAKDLVVAGKIELPDIPKYADKFLNYILSIKRKEDK